MRSAIFTLLLIAALILLRDSKVFGQDVIGLDCPPTATVAGQKEALRSATERYLTALKAKDWETTSKLSVSFLVGYNLTQALMQDLLEPLKIESLSFEVHEPSVKPSCEASVAYTLSLRALDPQTQKRAIDVMGLVRVTHWRRFHCDCPPENVTPWMLDSDVAEVSEPVRALAEAKTTQEQRLLLLAQGENELKELAADLARRGTELLKMGQDAEASEMFRLNRATLGQVRHHIRIWNLRQASGVETILAEAEKKNDRSAQASLLNSLGQIYLKIGDEAKALKLFEDGLRLTDASNREVAASAYSSIAVIYRNRGDFTHALEYFLKSLELYKQLTSGLSADDSVKDDFTEALFNVAFLYEALGREELAQNSYRELLGSVGKESQEEGLFLLLLGTVNTVKGNVSEAIDYLERASSILARSTSEDKATFNVITSALLVESYLRRNDYAHAATHLLKARTALKEAKEGEISESFIPLIESMLYGSEGDKQLAASRTRKGLVDVASEILRKSGKDDSSGGVSHSDDAEIAFSPNLLALHAVGSILGGVLEDKRENEVFNILVVLNAAALERVLKGGEDDLEAARKWFLRVLAEAEGDELLIAQTHEWIAGVYLRQKNYPEALRYYQKSLELIEHAHLPLTYRLTELEPTVISIWRSIARIHAASGNYEQALASYRKILDRGARFYRLLDTTLLYEVAEINFKLSRYEDTLSTINQALAVAAGGGDRDMLWKLQTLAGKSQRALKRDAAAARSFAEAIREIELNRYGVVGGSRITERFFEDKLDPYHAMIAMLVEQGQCEEALMYAERSKSRVLLDALSHGTIDASRPLTAAELEREQALRGRMIVADREFSAAEVKSPDTRLVSQLREKRLEARLEYEAFRIGLELPRAVGGARSGAQADTVGPAEMAALLPPASGALLEFAVTEDKTFLFVLTEGDGKTDGKRAHSSPVQCKVHSIAIGAKELNERVAMLNARIANEQSVVKPLARELYELLFKPAQAALSGRTVLVIVPDRYLWTLPFQALQSSDGRYLLQESAIYYAPSLTSLREMRKVQAGNTARLSRENPTLLVMANPAGSSPSLLATEAQAPRIAQLYGQGRSKVYVGADADEGRFKKEARSFDVIHLGAHGLFDDDDPMYSRILLSRETERRAERTSTNTPTTRSNEDGLLEAWEIMDLRLKANLVVLSACETARGRVGDGEGIVGLTWALFMGGVPSTVVSQWKVNEGATTKLMYRFHENFVKCGSPDPAHPCKAEALRQASLRLIGSENYSHPYYWAGFVLVGDGN